MESLLAVYEAEDLRLDLDVEAAATLLTGDREPELETKIGPYQLVSKLGQGGMGTVFLARRVEGGFEQRVALKLIKRGMDSEAIERRFQRERQILATLNHPRIAQLLDGGISSDGRPWFAMELVEGEPITIFAESHRLSLDERIELFLRVCDAVASAHRSLVVHRDLKPSNLLVTTDGEPRLLDFGIAKLLDPESIADDETREGRQILTPGYASPEQVLGRPVTTGSDVYGLGVVLYELLVGRSPYRGPMESAEEVRRLVCETPAPLGSEVARAEQDPDQSRRARQLHGDLDAVLATALAKEPERRYRSVEALAEDLRRYLAGHPVVARAPGALYRFGKFVRRHRVAAITSTLLLGSLLIGLAGVAWQARIAAGERDRATAQAQKAEEVQRFLASLLESVDPFETGGAPWTAEQLVDHGIARIDETDFTNAGVEADLLGVLGGVSRSLGQLERAEGLWRRALELRRDRGGADAAAEAADSRGLARVLVDLDRHEEAAIHFDRALEIQRREAAADDSPETRRALALTLGDHGVSRYLVGDLEGAALRFREALDLFEGLPGDQRAGIASQLVSLGGIARDQGDYTTAERQLRRALELEREVLGPRHPGIATTMGHLARLLRDRGRYTDAEPLYREALEIARESLGSEHPSITTKMSNVALISRSLGRFEESVSLYREVLALDRAQLGDEHPYVAYSLDNLAISLGELGAFDEALALLNQAQAILLRTRGSESVDYATHRAARGTVLRLQGKPAQALSSLEEAREILRRLLSAGHVRELHVMASMAQAQTSLGHHSKAIALLEEVLALRDENELRNHPDSIRVLEGLASALRSEGRHDEALSLLEEADAIATSALPASHWQRARVALALAQAVRDHGQEQRAQGLVERARATLAVSEGVRAERLRAESLDGAIEVGGS